MRIAVIILPRQDSCFLQRRSMRTSTVKGSGCKDSCQWAHNTYQAEYTGPITPSFRTSVRGKMILPPRCKKVLDVCNKRKPLFRGIGNYHSRHWKPAWNRLTTKSDLSIMLSSPCPVRDAYQALLHDDEIPQCQSGFLTSGIAVSSAPDSGCNRSRYIHQAVSGRSEWRW